MTAVAPTLQLAGGSVVTEHGTLQQLDVVVEHGRITQLVAPGSGPPSTGPTIDVSHKIVAPGLIDVQINGGWGHDFTGDPATIGEVARHLPTTGVTAFVPTIVTSPPLERASALAALAALEPNQALGHRTRTPLRGSAHLSGATRCPRSGPHRVPTDRRDSTAGPEIEGWRSSRSPPSWRG